jgi:hypothetical protein
VGSYGWPSTFLAKARETVAPPRGGKDGLLPPLLVALTAVTGLVDAFSYLVLGHVFVGAVVGAVLVLHVRIVYPLAVALVILAAVAVTGMARSRSPESAV